MAQNVASSSQALEATNSGPSAQEVDEWMVSQDPPLKDWRKVPYRALSAAIRFGELEILKSMNLSLTVLQDLFDLGFGYERALNVACRHGQLAIVQWLLERGVKIFVIPQHWRDAMAAHTPHYFAATHNHVDVLKLLHQTRPFDPTLWLELLNDSALKGAIDVLDWLLSIEQQIAPLSKQQLLRMNASAIGSGSLVLIEYLTSRKLMSVKKLMNSKNTPYWEPFLATLVEHDRIEFLDWLVSQGWKPKRCKEMPGSLANTISATFRFHRFEALRWFVKHGVYPTSVDIHKQLISDALGCGTLEMIQYALQQLPGNVPNFAAFDPPALWISVLNRAAGSSVSRFLMENHGCVVVQPVEEHILLRRAAQAGNLEYLQWRPPPPAHVQETLLWEAARTAQMEVAQWMVIEMKYPVIWEGCRTTLLHQAAGTGDLRFVQWVVEGQFVKDVNDMTGGVRPLDVALERPAKTIEVSHFLATHGAYSTSQGQPSAL